MIFKVANTVLIIAITLVYFKENISLKFAMKNWTLNYTGCEFTRQLTEFSLHFLCLDHCIFTFPSQGLAYTSLSCLSFSLNFPSHPTLSKCLDRLPWPLRHLFLLHQMSTLLLQLWSTDLWMVCLQWKCFSHHRPTLLRQFLNSEPSSLNIFRYLSLTRTSSWEHNTLGLSSHLCHLTLF